MEVSGPIAVLRAQQADQLPTSWGVSGGILAPCWDGYCFCQRQK
jgi:hypothetical protein